MEPETFFQVKKCTNQDRRSIKIVPDTGGWDSGMV
jgi:hypothetical protein